MARDYNPQSDPWAAEPTSVKLYRRECESQGVDACHEEGIQSWRRLLGRLKTWQEPVSVTDQLPASRSAAPDMPESPASTGASPTVADSSPSEGPKRRILTERDYQAWLQAQQTIISCDVLSGMRTNPPFSLRTRL